MARLYQNNSMLINLQGKSTFKLLFVCFFISTSMYTRAQQLPNSAVQVSGGYSKHGSGDLNGIVFGAGYTRYMSPRVSLHYNFSATINHAKDTYLVNNNTTGVHTDASIRSTTAGVQLGVSGRYSFLRNAK